MENKVTWLPSPAKINLFLHVLGRYENGYHQLESLFQLLDYGDDIGFEITQDSTITLANQISGVAQQDNLIHKAAMAIKKYANSTCGCTLHIRKRLPMGGGIGGGSSNAATVLVGLNHLWQCGLKQQQLAEIALSLGADVPVFVLGCSAFAQGVGEQLTPTAIPKSYYLVATPNVHVATQDIFTHADLPRNTQAIDLDHYSFEKTHNDCQTLVTNMHPDVANLLQWLLHYAPSRMSGTGASCFAIFAAKEDAQRVLELLPSEFSGFVAQGVDRSGLHQQLGV